MKKLLCLVILLIFVVSANAETVRILYNLDGTISIVHPAPNSKKSTETEAQWLERVFTKSNPDGLEYEDVDVSEIPIDREYRDAWEKEKNKPFKINQVKKQAKDKKKTDKQSAKNKLKLGQPMTDDEILALFGD